MLGPWRPNGHHDYEIGARCKVHGRSCSHSKQTLLVFDVYDYPFNDFEFSLCWKTTAIKYLHFM